MTHFLHRDDREDRLPRWAQDLITRLRESATSAEKRVQAANDRAERHRLATYPDKSAVVLEGCMDGDTGLGDEARIRFYPNGQGERGLRADWIDAHRTGKDYLILRASRGLVIEPNASNTVYLKVAPW